MAISVFSFLGSITILVTLVSLPDRMSKRFAEQLLEKQKQNQEKTAFEVWDPIQPETANEETRM